jgi:hypothetical protein
MKKTIILGFFASMIILSYFTTKVVTHLFSDDIEIYYDKEERHLSVVEEEMRNILHKKGHHVNEKIDIKYTYIKKNFGWDMKIDTVSRGTFYEKD